VSVVVNWQKFCANRAVFFILSSWLLVACFAGRANAVTLDWGTFANGTNLITTTASKTVSGVTITAHSVATGAVDAASTSATTTASSNGSAAGIIQLSMDAANGDKSTYVTTTFTFSQPVINLSFTLHDIDGGPACGAGCFYDIVDFNSNAGVPTSATPASGVAYNAALGEASAIENAGISDATGNVTVNWNVPVTSVTIKYIAGSPTAVVSNSAFQVLFIDDLNFSLMPTLAISKTSTGGVGTFNFSTSNSGSGSTATNITTATAGTAVTGSATRLLATATATTITETGPAGWVFNPATSTCTDSASATSGNPASFAATVSGYVITVPAANIVPNAVITCAITNAKVPTLQLAKTTVGAIGTFNFSGDNGFGTDSITTTTASTPANGAVKSLAAAATTTTITETVPAGWQVNSGTCTGTTPANYSFNAASAQIVLNSAATAPNNTLVCTFTNTLLPSVAVQKITTGGFGGPFTFTQSGLASAPSPISTSVAATATPASPLPIQATIGTAVSLTEAIATGFITGGVSCVDSNAAITGNATVTSATSAVTIPAGNIKAGATYVCQFTNITANPQLSIVKTASPAGPVSLGQVITYTYTIANIGNVPMTNVQVKDMHGSPAAQVANGAGGITSEVLTVAGPSGSGASPDTTANDGVWSTLAPGATVQFTFSYAVTQADIDHG